MLVKSQVKYIQSLGHKKLRDADGVFVAEGPKIVSEFLVSNRLELVQCFATENWLQSNRSLLEGKEKKVIVIDENDLERISFHNSPNDVLAVFTKPLFDISRETNGVSLLLDTIQDPGNLGTILRTADWFGIQQIVCSEETADVFSPKVIQSAMGSIVRVAAIYTNLHEFLRLHPDVPVYATSLDGEDLENKLRLSDAFILIGNESKGIHAELVAKATRKIRIPRKGKAESLNVAVATGIILSQIEYINQTGSL